MPQHLEVNRSMPSCPTCNADNASTSSFCSACGAALEDTLANPYASEPASRSPTEDAAPTNPGDSQLLELLRAGKKIHAIKIYRDKAGCGLKDAKDYVESLGSRHGIATVSAGGCAGMLLLMFAALSAAVAVSVHSW
jgi:ribosomal protein L7/L12